MKIIRYLVILITLMVTACAMQSPRSQHQGLINGLDKVGIGASVTRIQGKYYFVDIISGGPLEQTGIVLEGDQLLEISENNDGVFNKTSTMTLAELVSLIRGYNHSQLKLKLQRGQNIFTVVVTRANL